jgi:mannonate dehydratase
MTTIERIEVIRTAPAGARLVVVKVHTSEPGLYGLGCASLTFRGEAIERAIEDLAALAIGWDVARIEDFFQAATHDSYWRNGPILNCAISGIDMALWDILGKTAGLPLHQLLGGKSREGAAVYGHARGGSPEEIAEDVLRLRSLGYRYVRLPVDDGRSGEALHSPRGAARGFYHDPAEAVRSTIANVAGVRERVGEEIGLLVDVHERLAPPDVIRLAKALEPFDLFFLEDPLPPELGDWFRRLRSQTSIPIAMGELWSNPAEWVPLVRDNLIDYVRCHLSAIGGITPARKLAAFCEVHGVRTAWHGPGDVSPVGHAANLHLDVNVPNFGIQELGAFSDAVHEVFPGTPEIVDGYAYPNDLPGLGIDIDVAAAARYPAEASNFSWPAAPGTPRPDAVMRRPDGSVMRP